MPFIFRPGGVADPANGIYVTWAGVMAALNAAPAGPKTIQFDDSINSPIVIPPGTFAMSSITWGRAATANTPCLINLGEGRIFTNLRSFAGALQITFTGTTPPVSDFSAGDIVSMDGGAIIRCTSGPFFRNTVSGGRPVVLALVVASWLAAGNPVFDSAVVGAFTLVSVTVFDTVINLNMLMGVNGSTIAIVDPLFSLFVSVIGFNNVSEIHPNFDGLLLPGNSPRWRLLQPPVITASTVLQIANQISRIDPTAGPLTVTLPSVKGNRGVPIHLKNVSDSINPITIAPAAGETIDGNALGATIAAARGSMILIADGTSDWSRF